MSQHTPSTWTNPTTVDHAAQIRATLKSKHGWTSRQISVKAHCYSMGSSLRIRVNDPSIPLSKVKAIAKPAESIDRDQFGEILGGGNRFVFVDYSPDAVKALRAKWGPLVRVAVDALASASDSALIPVPWTPYLIGKSQQGGFSLWGDSHLCNRYDDDGLAEEIGTRMVDGAPMGRA